MDVIASGSTDHRARLWRLSDGVLLRSLDSQSHWTVTVQLRALDDGSNALLTMSKKEIHVFRWKGEDELRVLPPSTPSAVVPLKPEGSYQELRDAFFTPGLALSGDGGQVTFVRQMPLFETQTIGDADIITVDVGTGRTLNGVHINQKVRKLLAVGKRYALALLPYVDAKVYKNLAVIDLAEKRIIGGCTVPHSR